MDRQEALRQKMAYLDRQLAPGLHREVEAALAADPELAADFERERQYLAFLRRACAAVPAPAGFQERLADRLARLVEETPERGTEPWSAAEPGPPAPSHGLALSTQLPAASRPRPVRESRSWPRWAAWAATVGLVVGVSWLLRTAPQCAYLNACAEAHAKLAQPALRSADANILLQYMREHNLELKALPSFELSGLQPVGAGSTKLVYQGQLLPEGYYLQYTGTRRAEGEPPLTLILHQWPGNEPNPELFDPQAGVWKGEHEGLRIVSFRTPGDQILCTAISKRPMEQLVQLASTARAALVK